MASAGMSTVSYTSTSGICSQIAVDQLGSFFLISGQEPLIDALRRLEHLLITQQNVQK